MGVLLVALGLFVACSLLPVGGENLVGPLGAATRDVLLRVFSWGGVLLPLLALVWGIVLVRGRGSERAVRFSVVAGAGTLACLIVFAVLEEAPRGSAAPAAGMLAHELAAKLRGALGVGGALIAVGLGILLTLVFFSDEADRPGAASSEGGRSGSARSGRAAPAAVQTARRRARGFEVARKILQRAGRAFLWCLALAAAALAWLVSWVAGMLGVLVVALGAAFSRLSRRRTSFEEGHASSAPGDAPAWERPARDGRAPAAAVEDADLARRPLLSEPLAEALGDPRFAEGRRSGDPGARESRRGARPASARARRGPPLPVEEPVWQISPELFDPVPARDPVASERELQEQGAVLIRKLADFNVRGEIVRISSGPVITQFEVEPAPGVKVNQIANLADDLALAMRAQRIRIVAPIPGRGAVGIEIPNRHPERVTIRELFESRAFHDFRGTLPIALGKEISGAPVVADLTRMPHLLIAGATGSGKSVCINALLTSLLYVFSPAQLRLILIDPKMLELTTYNDVPHLLHPVVTRPKDAAIALKWAVYEMERRFELLARNGARNIGDFNARLLAGAELEGVDSKLGSADEPLSPLTYVVVVVDELADLMLTVQAEIEEPLARLAQKARAVGIHVVLATQRPSVNVLTGFIKANFPSRISFQVASKTDSRTILDQNGAEALLGSGDMLFLPADRAVPIRIQGAHVSTRETEALVANLREMARARELTPRETIDLQQVESAEQETETPGERDELFFEAARVVIEHDQGSTSLLQRRLKVGYSRAARIVDQLYENGIVGPADGSKPREVRVGLEELAQMQAGSHGSGTRTTARSTSPA